MLRRSVLSVLVTPLLSLGCSAGPPTRFFALTPMEAPAAAVDSDLSIGVLPIALATYLDRSGIVVRTSPNELAVSTLHTWIEPLDIQARRVIARDLGVLLGTDHVFVLPEQRLMPVDYVVEVAIERFEIVTASGDAALDPERSPIAGETVSDGEVAILEARWLLLSGDERRVLSTAPERLTVVLEGVPTFERRVAALSEALGRLSRAIATQIATRPA